jgi:hypothetical protein
MNLGVGGDGADLLLPLMVGDAGRDLGGWRMIRSER